MKKILLFTILFFPFYLSAQTIPLNGIISYQFNTLYPAKADLGAAVYLISANDIGQDDYSIILHYELQLSYFNTWYTYKSYHLYKKTHIAKEEMEREGIRNRKDLNNAYAVIYPILIADEKKALAKTSVNGIGEFKLDIPKEGIYYVIIISANTSKFEMKYLTITDSSPQNINQVF